MPEVRRSRTGDHLRNLFQILIDAGDAGLPAREALDQLRDTTTLTDHEAGTYETGDNRFDKIVRFGTLGPVKAGWLEKDKGVWRVTQSGVDAHRTFKSGLAFVSESDRLYRAWDRARKGTPSEHNTPGDSVAVPSDEAAVTIETAVETAWTEIRQYLGAMQPYAFQDLVADLLRAMGFHPLWVAPPGRDGGIDIVAFPDALGLEEPRVKVQVKRQKERVDVQGIRAFLSVLGEGDVGLFVTLGGFTSEAKSEARTQVNRRLTLLDADRLFDLWVQHYSKLSDEARQRMPIRPVYFLAPST